MSGLHLNTCVIGDLSLVKCIARNHALIEIDKQKLPYDFVAFLSIGQAHTSAAISPERLISCERVVDGLVNLIVFL
jgi:hypothetical protein